MIKFKSNCAIRAHYAFWAGETGIDHHRTTAGSATPSSRILKPRDEGVASPEGKKLSCARASRRTLSASA